MTRAQMAVFVIKATADEAPHIVGDPGEPVLLDGGEGDCVWQNLPPSFIPSNPVSFWKDSDGIVHLAGFPVAEAGVGGDGACDDILDLRLFRLPVGYRPEHVEVFPTANSDIGAQLVIPVGGATINGVFIPAGTVVMNFISSGNATTLDGITFRAADPQTAPPLSAEPPSMSLDALRDLLGKGPRAGAADGER